MFLPHVVVTWLYNTAYQIVRVRFCVFGPNWIVFVSEVRPDCVLRNTVLLMWVAVLTVQPPVYATHTNTHTNLFYLEKLETTRYTTQECGCGPTARCKRAI